ncbi:hypothetical protein Tco_0850235 [Tanacetum coccineum]
MQEVILFYNGLGIPTRQILDSRGAIPSKTAADAKVMDVLTSDEIGSYTAQLNNLGIERSENCPPSSHSKERGKPSRKLIHAKSSGPFSQEGILELAVTGMSIKEHAILRIKNKGNLWKIP